MVLSQVKARAGERLIVGVSAHSVEEALAAQENGADYLGVGAVFATATKENVRAMPPALLRAICSAVEIPVVAIGGIHRENMMQLRRTFERGA